MSIDLCFISCNICEMQIKEWLSISGKNQSDLARLIGRDRARAHRLVNGKLMPSEDEMLLIFQESGGLVTGNDVYNLPINDSNAVTKKQQRNTSHIPARQAKTSKKSGGRSKPN